MCGTGMLLLVIRDGVKLLELCALKTASSFSHIHILIKTPSAGRALLPKKWSVNVFTASNPFVLFATGDGPPPLFFWSLADLQ